MGGNYLRIFVRSLVTVDIWTVCLTEECERILSAQEEARAARFFTEKLRLHWARAHSRLRLILAGYLKTDPLKISFGVNAYGKPSVAGIEFNLSHTEEFAMIAVCREVPVGIDIERLRPKVDMAALLKRLGETDLPEDPPGLHERWARREAQSKARGGALFDAVDPGAYAVALQAPEDHFASVAAMGSVPAPTYCRGKR